MTVTGDTAPADKSTEEEHHAPRTDGTAPEATRDDGPQADENREAAKYRHRAKAAESERDRLAERLTVFQRAEVERLAGTHLADGQDFWRDGAQLADVLDDGGNVDPAKVTATASALLEAHGHWRKLSHPAAPASTVTSDGKIGGSGRPSFVDAFRRRSE